MTCGDIDVLADDGSGEVTPHQFGLARPAPVDRGLARVRLGGYLPLGDRHRERIEAAQDERIPAGRLACGRDLREPAQ